MGSQVLGTCEPIIWSSQILTAHFEEKKMNFLNETDAKELNPKLKKPT